MQNFFSKFNTSIRCIATLSTENLLNNLEIVKSLTKPDTKIIAMVKANAYGHGIRSVSKKLDKLVDMFGVSSLEEAKILAHNNIKSEIIITQGINTKEEINIAASLGFHTVFHSNFQLNLISYLEKNLYIKPWIKINTGMNRLGFSIDEAEEAFKFLLSFNRKDKLRILSHFGCADIKDHPLNEKQIKNFCKFVEDKPADLSLCNSAGMINFPEYNFDYVRPGIMIYGINPVKDSHGPKNLKQVMSLYSYILSIRHVKAGESIGYGARYVCNKDMKIGIVGFGYGDGYKFLTNKGFVLVKNKRADIVGSISMDMTAIDLSDHIDIKEGDTVVLCDESLPVDLIAKEIDSNSWDFMSKPQNRVKYFWK